MQKKDIDNYRGVRELQRDLKKAKPIILGVKETDVLLELYLTDGWTSCAYLREKTEQPHCDLSSRSLGPLEIKGYVQKRSNNDHSKDIRITPKGKKLVERL